MGAHTHSARGRLAGLAAAAVCALLPARARSAPPVQVDAPVDRVRVFSQHARVVHRAQVTIGAGGATQVDLLALPEVAQQESLRVACKTARVERVQVIRAAGRLRGHDEAAKLLGKIEGALDGLARLGAERNLLQTELSLLSSLRLKRGQPEGTAPAPQPGLFPDAWRRVLDWVERRSQDVRKRLAALSAEQHAKRQALHALRVEARELDLAAATKVVPRVVAAFKGRAGPHRVEVSYLVPGASWKPSYDLRYDPGSRTVEATYYGMVAQSSGTDWDGARLRFSTDRPTQLIAVPELRTQVLGRKRDFTPTPRPAGEPRPRAWQPPTPAVAPDPVLARLRQVLAGDLEGELDGAPERDEDQGGADRDGDRIPDARDKCPSHPETYNGIQDRDGCPDGGRVRLQKRPRRSYLKRSDYDFADDEVAGAMARPQAAPPAPSPSGGRVMAESVARSSGRSRSVPAETLPWTETGYREPTLHRDLPAAAAQGYRYVLYAPGRHTVKTGGQRQRVPILRERLEVRPTLRILPGKSKRAYLVAEVTNTTGRPILRGHANLFSGRMFSGRSWLNTALPGKTIKLPLGVDDGVKVERHIRQKTVEKGVVFKDDVSDYTVTIELANHHRYPVRVEVRDQVPVEQGEKVEVKLLSAKPKMKGPDKQGHLRWTGTVKGRAVKKLTFTFRITRPKDWKLRQIGG